MIFKLFAYCMTAILTLLMFWVIGWMWFAASVVSMKPQAQDIKTDAIIVLTGGDGRVNEGLNLLSQGKAEKLFVSGVNEKVTPQELVSFWKGDQSKILCCLTLGYIAETTASNATESQQWIRKNNVKSIRLVTSNYHMARSSLMFHTAIPDLQIYKHPVISKEFQPWSKRFWILTFQEYNKVLAAWLRLDLVNKNPALING
jgi:uncharacterized SAM-binding protein YcdF (DUF218 family)